MTLDDVEAECQRLADSAGAYCSAFQSNHEGAIVDRVHAARNDGTVGIIINAGAYTHTSVAIRDALVGVGIPFLEVHVSGVILDAQPSRRKRVILMIGVFASLADFQHSR